jgi:predicted esterase
MNIERLIQKDIGDGIKMNYMRYSNGSKNVVVWYHGVGEEGPIDGSKIDLVEKLEGFPKFARGKRPWSSTITGSIEYPFDIIAVQVKKHSDFAQSYDFLKPRILPFLRDEYGYQNIIVGGISMGNYGAYRLIIDPPGKELLKGFVAICGSASTSSISSMVKLPGIAWHGTADPTVSYSGHKSFVDAYNAAGGQVEWNALDGVGHNAWTYAFNSDPSKDKSLQKVNQIFASIPASGDTAALERENAELKAKIQNAKNIIGNALNLFP